MSKPCRQRGSKDYKKYRINNQILINVKIWNTSQTNLVGRQFYCKNCLQDHPNFYLFKRCFRRIELLLFCEILVGTFAIFQPWSTFDIKYFSLFIFFSRIFRVISKISKFGQICVGIVLAKTMWCKRKWISRANLFCDFRTL